MWQSSTELAWQWAYSCTGVHCEPSLGLSSLQDVSAGPVIGAGMLSYNQSTAVIASAPRFSTSSSMGGILWTAPPWLLLPPLPVTWIHSVPSAVLGILRVWNFPKPFHSVSCAPADTRVAQQWRDRAMGACSLSMHSADEGHPLGLLGLSGGEVRTSRELSTRCAELSGPSETMRTSTPLDSR